MYNTLSVDVFALYSLLLLSFFLYLKSAPIHVIVHVHVYMCRGVYAVLH